MPGILARDPDPAATSALPRRQLTRGFSFGVAERLGLLVAAAQVATAVYLVGGLGLAAPEAVARTAHLGVLYDGIDPGVVAIGLERPPLTSLLALPFGAVAELRTDGLAVAIATALGGFLAVPIALPLARWAGLGRWARRLFVAAIACHPLLWYAGAVGLPEGIYALLLLGVYAQVARWIDTESTGSVIAAGALLGLTFLVRYNVVWIGVVVVLAVFWVGNARSPLADRPDRAQAWVAAMAVPLVFAIGLWVLGTWLLTGDSTGFLSAAADLSALGADRTDVLDRMAQHSGDAIATGGWVLGWSALIGAPSLVAIAALLVHGAVRRRPESMGLGLVLGATLLPECIALVSGQGQAHVPHLFAIAMPAFVAFAYWERREAGGAPPGPYDDRRRRRQVLVAAGLLIAALGSAAALPLLPAADGPAPDLLDAIREGEHRPADPSAALVARWAEANVGPGDLLVDIERHAAVLVAADDGSIFRTAADEGDDAVLFDPFGIAEFVLVRAPLPGQGPGWIERAHPGIFDAGRPFMSLHRDFGDYRVYQVESAAFR